MSHLLPILLALAGFALIAVSMGRHQADMAGRRLSPIACRRARIGGHAVLVLIFLLDVATFGPAYGAITWFGHLSVGAWSIVAWLCVRVHCRTSSASAIRPIAPFRREN